jgi:hypothetical protein
MTPLTTTYGPPSEDWFWHMFHSVRGDVEAAIGTNNAYHTINRLAVADRKVYDKYQRSAHFWSLNTYALQTTFFIAFGRIFDNRNDSFSIQKLIEATIANPAIFSKAALLERKRRVSHIAGADPQWLIDFVDQAWEPTGADLVPLRAVLAPHLDKFKAIYRPIRHTEAPKASKPSRRCSARRSKRMSRRFLGSCTRSCGRFGKWPLTASGQTSPISQTTTVKCRA